VPHFGQRRRTRGRRTRKRRRIRRRRKMIGFFIAKGEVYYIYLNKREKHTVKSKV
jgi:hypothetical protein